MSISFFWSACSGYNWLYNLLGWNNLEDLTSHQWTSRKKQIWVSTSCNTLAVLEKKTPIGTESIWWPWRSITFEPPEPVVSCWNHLSSMNHQFRTPSFRENTTSNWTNLNCNPWRTRPVWMPSCKKPTVVRSQHWCLIPPSWFHPWKSRFTRAPNRAGWKNGRNICRPPDHDLARSRWG